MPTRPGSSRSESLCEQQIDHTTRTVSVDLNASDAGDIGGSIRGTAPGETALLSHGAT